MVTAINKKYQAIVNRIVRADKSYNECVNVEDRTNALDRKQERYFDKACELMQELPKREQQNIIKSIPDTKFYL